MSTRIPNDRLQRTAAGAIMSRPSCKRNVSRRTQAVSPRRIDPSVDYRRLGDLSTEFTNLWRQLQAFYLDATVGFRLVREHVDEDQFRSRANVRETELDSEEFQDTRSFTYQAIFSGEFCTSGIHRATQGEVKARNAPDGANFIALGRLCLVSFYDYWNEYLRREIVVAKGKLDPQERDDAVKRRALREHGSHDLWGDIRLLRNSIVHNQGIATSDVAGCRLVKWFRPGNPIALTPDRMRLVFLGLLRYRNELFAEQFPEHYIKVPER